MGLGQSTEGGANPSSPEELSYALAKRFATKCFTPLELTHFKDIFFSRALDQGGVKYWNEKILSDFLGIPDGSETPSRGAVDTYPVDAGPVVFRMVSYLGAFPFQNTLAPSVLTFEAMVKVVVLLTERYGKVLRRGRKDRLRLLFGSLADVGRKESMLPEPDHQAKEATPSDKSHVPGFAVDQPSNDDEYEDGDGDDDDLALAALESLDAIEVLKHDQRIDKTVYEARISTDTFYRLLMLLLVIAPLSALEPVTKYTLDLRSDNVETIQKQAKSILASFDSEGTASGISYKTFARTVSTSLPYLFDPLTSLFEHMLFSSNLDLSQKRNRVDSTGTAPPKAVEELETPSLLATPVLLPGSFETAVLQPSILSHISFFLPGSSSIPNFFRSNVRLHPVFSTASHGSSLTAFSHHVLTWKSATLLIIQGSREAKATSSNLEDTKIILGAYLPHPWNSLPPSSSSSTSPKDHGPSPLPYLFQLYPKHLLLPGNPSPSAYKPNTPAAHFATRSGIAVGCEIPPSSRSSGAQSSPKPHGAGSLLIETSLETADFYLSPVGPHNGVFLPSPAAKHAAGASASASDKLASGNSKTRIQIDYLEVWGFLFADSEDTARSVQSPVELQRERWDFEEREAERRRSVNLKTRGPGADFNAENARWLLETAGLIGDGRPSGRSGGSV